MQINKITHEYKTQNPRTLASKGLSLAQHDSITFTANKQSSELGFKVTNNHVWVANELKADYSGLTPISELLAHEKQVIVNLRKQIVRGEDALNTLGKVYLPETSLEYITEDLRITNAEKAQEESENILDAISVISTDKMLQDVNAGTTLSDVESYFNKSIDNTQASALQNIVVSMTDVYNALDLLKKNFSPDMTLGEIQGRTIKNAKAIKNPNNDALGSLVDVIKDNFVSVFSELDSDYMPMSTTLEDCRNILKTKKERIAKAEERVIVISQALVLFDLPQGPIEKVERLMYPNKGNSLSYMAKLLQNWASKQQN